ncbi:hypothetical protein HMPREF9554_00123 [Treponema phagedenis F0421]|nr:hypothetical protein HMPREF9554_00123 [Treponema phagedenis F0421]
MSVFTNEKSKFFKVYCFVDSKNNCFITVNRIKHEIDIFY